jgi:hypothetical protein
MRIVLFILIFLIIGLAFITFRGCRWRQATQIPDPTKPAALTLNPSLLQFDSVHGLSLRIHGHLDGAAIISSGPVQTQRVSGDFDIRYASEYYNSNCTIHYSPEGVLSGKVLIEYEFLTAF